MDTLELDDGERFISKEMVARRLDVVPDTVMKMVKDGRFIPPVRLGSVLRWRDADVNAFIVERAASARKIVATAKKAAQTTKRARDV